MTTEFERGFQDELLTIVKQAQLQIIIPAAIGAGVSTGFGGYDIYKALQEQNPLSELPRTEEEKEKTYWTKYPTVNPSWWPLWASGKALERFGRSGDTFLHRGASLGSGTLAAGTEMLSPTTSFQKMLGG